MWALYPVMSATPSYENHHNNSDNNINKKGKKKGENE